MRQKLIAVVVALVSAGSLLAHHSLTNYDTTKPVRLKGTIVEFHQINPHTILFIEAKGEDGQLRRWAIEGPSVLQLTRTGFAKNALKAGDTVEVCGYAPKEPIVWQIASGETGVSMSGRLLNAEIMTFPDGKQRSWGDYGVHKCFEAGYTDQHSK